MRYMDFFGRLDDIFAKYRKEEMTDDSEWSPYCQYQGYTDVRHGDDYYTVYHKDVVPAVHNLIRLYAAEEHLELDEKFWHDLDTELVEIAPHQNNKDDAYTDIMFRTKFYTMFFLHEWLKDKKVHS